MSIDLDVAAVDVAPSRPPGREKPVAAKPAGGRMRRFFKRVAIVLFVLLVLAGAGYALFASGLIAVVEPGSRATQPKPAAAAASGQQTASALMPAASNGLPGMVANLPAVVAPAACNDPASVRPFQAALASSATNAPEDESQASRSRACSSAESEAPDARQFVRRHAARKITEAYLAYMQGLQTASPESIASP